MIHLLNPARHHRNTRQLHDLTAIRPTALRPKRHDWRRRNLIGLAVLTAYSTALGWQAQLVSYPLFGAVSANDFAAYHDQYNAAIPVVVILPGFVTFLGGLAFYWTRPPDVPRPAAALVGASGLVSLLATVMLAIPMHDRLDRDGLSAATIDSLLDANLLRSLALTGGALTLAWCVSREQRRT